MTVADYDYSWLNEGLLKRKANHSNVVCFETPDPFRLSQVKACMMGYREYSNTDLYYLNRWTGLCKIKRENGVLEPVARGVGGAYDQGIENSIQEVRDALKYLDNVIKTRKSVVILHDIDAARPEEKDKDLIDAIRDWSFNNEIMLTDSIIILICANVSSALDVATMERVALIRPPLSEPQERIKMIAEQWHKLLEKPLDTNEVSLLVQATAGLNLHQVKTILLESYYRTHGFCPETMQELKSDVIKRSDLLEIEEPDPAGFSSVGGYEAVKRFVRNTIIRSIMEPERARAFDIRIPRGIIFFGPPGTGKTLFARAIAKEVQLPFINFRTENLFSQYLGVSGHRFRDAIHLIEQMSPAVVFMDEIDRLGKRRGEVSDGASEETRRVYNQVLEWLGKKERKSIIIGTTNRPGDLDRAFRVGRIDYWIPFLYPNREAREAILRIHLRGIEISDETVKIVTERTEGYSGAEIEELVNRAKRRAFTGTNGCLVAEDIVKAHEAFRIDSESRMREREGYFKMAEEFTNDLEFLRELRNER